MIPPPVRVGTPPVDTAVNDTERYALLTARRGWCVATWSCSMGRFVDLDRSLPLHESLIALGEILCWMPGDGT